MPVKKKSAGKKNEEAFLTKLGEYLTDLKQKIVKNVPEIKNPFSSKNAPKAKKPSSAKKVVAPVKKVVVAPKKAPAKKKPVKK